MKIRIAVVLILLLAVGWWMTRVSEGKIVVQKGDSVSGVAESLSDADIVSSAFVFKVAYKIFNTDENVYPGLIDIKNDCSMRCLVHQITSPSRSMKRVTFTEGQDVRDLARLLQKKQIGNTSELYALVGMPATAPTKRADLRNEFPFLKDVPSAISYEGYLFPDTYDLPNDITTEGFVKLMLRTFDRRVTSEMRAKAAAQGRTLHEVVTMASILEKEVRGTEDRRKVADLLWRREKKGMGLQVDASVNYATAKENLFTTLADRATISLWNTYKFKGLPIGPIGNPGLDAIEAALNPLPNDWWFYLTSPKGTVHYGRTLDEHIANKKYLR